MTELSLYPALLSEIKTRIRQGQTAAIQDVKRELLTFTA